MSVVTETQLDRLVTSVLEVEADIQHQVRVAYYMMAALMVVFVLVLVFGVMVLYGNAQILSNQDQFMQDAYTTGVCVPAK